LDGHVGGQGGDLATLLRREGGDHFAAAAKGGVGGDRCRARWRAIIENKPQVVGIAVVVGADWGELVGGEHNLCIVGQRGNGAGGAACK
jgi:hypothetical protein